MKKAKSFHGVVALAVAGFLLAPFASGQGFGVSGGTRNTDGLGGGAGIDFGPPKLPVRPAEPQTIRIELTVVGKPREWTNTEGTKITAALVAFPKAPDADEFTPVEILKDGKVRLLRGEDYRNVAEYPIEKLSEADREFVSNLALNIRLAADGEREKAEAAEIAAEEEKEKGEAAAGKADGKE